MSDPDSPRRPSQVRFSDDQEQSAPAAYPQAPSTAYLPPHVPFYGGPGYPVMPVPAPYWPGGNSLGVWLPADYPRRGSAESDATLNNDAHDGAPRPQSLMRRTNTDGLDSLEQGAMNRAAQRGQGLWSKLFNFRGGFNPAADGDDDSDDEGAAPISRANSESQSIFMKRSDSKMSVNSLSSVHNDHEGPLDADDPHVTGKRKEHLEDIEDVAHHMHQHMQHDYKARRREREKIKIEYHITSMENRQKFIIKLTRALMIFGAPSHRLEAQLNSVAKILEVDGKFVHMPNVTICAFGDDTSNTCETHFVRASGGLALGKLHRTHLIYRAVVHDEISAKKGTKQLQQLMDTKPVYNFPTTCILAFLASALICPLAFGGSFVDMWIAGLGALILHLLRTKVAAKSKIYANVFEITVAMLISFMAMALSSIKSQIFCYSAISSAGIIGILPGYLVLCSSLELASKNLICGSVKMVYALIYTLFLGFGLQIGSDIYLLFDSSFRHTLEARAGGAAQTLTVYGSMGYANATTATEHLLEGVYTFTYGSAIQQPDQINGCYRPPSFKWYLQAFPFWTQFLLVPLFSCVSSMANGQPWKSRQFLVMVIISCAAYAANTTANHFIFNHSDVVSAIGAFTVGLLGNIYSRMFGGTAFTSMVTGVLFLVPSGLSQAGGITESSGIVIGERMIAVVTGVTVGLFMSQSLVQLFGSKKNAAVFAF